MALINTDYIQPTELTGYVRESVANQTINQFSLARWLPNVYIDDLDYRFVRGGEGLIEAATFRAFDAESPIGARVGVTRVSGELPPISRKIRLGEYDRLRTRKDPSLSIRLGLMNDAERMARAVAARVELARGGALNLGTVAISENGFIATVDYGRAGGHSVTAGTLWSTVATATVIANLIAWRDVYIATNGEAPGALVGSSTILGYILQNAEMRTLAGSLAGTPARVTQDAASAVLSAFGLPPFYVYDAQVRVGNPAVATRILPVNKLLMLPAPTDPTNGDGTDLGATLWGTTAESLEPEYGVEGDEPGIVAGVYKDNDPVALWTKAAAIALPVLTNPNLSLSATVA